MPSHTRRPWRIAVLALLTALVAALGLPRAAWAHTGLIDSSPADGATVARPPDAVVLTFNERVLDQGTKVLVTGPDGSATRGDPRLADTTVVQALRPDLPAGRYTVEWRVTSVDGHPVSGELSFRVRAAPTTAASTRETPTPASATVSPPATAASPEPSHSAGPSAPATPDGGGEGGGGGSPWLWLLALIPLGIGAGWWLARRRRHP